jgi:bile acid:Na+ symporter, BASS family
MFSESMHVLDNIRLNFSEQSLLLMNITIAFIMFGVALDMKFHAFKTLLKKPKSLIVGFLSQFLLLPALTFLLILLIKPTQSVALGMLLVASCPGGNVSNFISALSKANLELSVSLTAISTISAIVLTPLNFAFWGGLYSSTSPLLRPIVIDPAQMFQTVLILLGIPLVLGVIFSQKFPLLTQKIFKPIRYASIFAFAGFIVGALSANFTNFLRFIEIIFILVLIHNALAFFGGFLIARFTGLCAADRRSISIETGIQNSGLGLALIFNPKIFPPDLEMGGMAFIAAWWGIWHIIAGMGLAIFWSYYDKRKSKNPVNV